MHVPFYYDKKREITSFLSGINDAAEAIVILNDHGSTAGVKFSAGSVLF